MSGDYIAKKEIAHLFVPAVGRKVIDLGGNLEKGVQSSFVTVLVLPCLLTTSHSSDIQVDW